MQVTLEYGRTGLAVELPDHNVVKCLSYQQTMPLEDPEAVVRSLLEQPTDAEPLALLAKGHRTACIVISDITRPVPNRLLLTPMLETLEAHGMPTEGITILVATGLHRPSTDAEKHEMLGPEIVSRYRIVDHDARREDDQMYLGDSPREVPVWVNRHYVEADLKILTGLIEPHFMAGFSGGRKAVCPGICGLKTIRQWHSPRFLEHENARIACLAGNPVHEENTWIAQRAGCDFMINVVLDAERNILKIVAGDMITAWQQGVDFARGMLTDTVDEPVDVVVTSAAGYPLDTTFYQCVKGMVAAASILKPGGTIILAAGMEQGVGSPEFERLLLDHPTMDGFMHRITQTDFFSIDQWQLEEMNKAHRIGRIMICSDGISHTALSRFFVTPVDSVESGVATCLAEYGPETTIAVMPSGPYVVAELKA